MSKGKSLFKKYSIGHFINEPDNNTDFEITLFETMEEPDVDDVHRHTFYEILWVDEGKSIQTIDFKKYELAERSLFFISPGQVHEFEEWKPLKGGTIMFTADFFLMHQHQNKLFELSFLDNMYSNPNLSLTLSEYQEIRQTIDNIYKESLKELRNVELLQAFLNVLLLQVQQAIDNTTTLMYTKKSLQLYKRFIQLLEHNFQENKTAADYADALHVSQRHLSRVVNEIANISTTRVIQERSMLEAKRLLCFSDMSVSEISDRLAYYDSSYFAKLFKKIEGVAPLRFRESMSEIYRR